MFIELDLNTSIEQAVIIKKAPINSLNPIISLVNNEADNIPTTTSNANKILTLPGSSISTLKNINNIDGRSQNIANITIQIKIGLSDNKLLDIIVLLPPGIKHSNKNINGTKKIVSEVFCNPEVDSAKLKIVNDIAHVIPAKIAIHSTKLEGKKNPCSIPIIISNPIKPNIIEIILFVVNF